MDIGEVKKAKFGLEMHDVPMILLIFSANGEENSKSAKCKPNISENKTCEFATVYCRSEEHTSELQSHVRISYAVFCLKKKKKNKPHTKPNQNSQISHDNKQQK